MLAFFLKALPFLAAAVVLWILLIRRMTGPNRARRLLQNLATLGVACAIALVAAEFTVRWFYRDITTTGDNTSYFARRWKKAHPPEKNEHGFRERGYTERPGDRVYRICVIGDSFTYGQGLDVEHRMTNLLEARLNREGGDRTYEVLNFGLPGTATGEHLQTLEEKVLKAEPDYVLLQYLSNDAEMGVQSGRPRPWALVPSSILSSILHRQSALYYLVNRAWADLQGAVGLTNSYTDYMIERFGDPDGEGARTASAAVEAFLERCRQAGVPVGMIVYPRLVDREPGHVDGLDFLLDRVGAICDRVGVPFVDLRETFEDIHPASKLWVNAFDAHPGVLANELATEAVLDAFRDEWTAPALHEPTN